MGHLITPFGFWGILNIKPLNVETTSGLPKDLITDVKMLKERNTLHRLNNYLRGMELDG